MSEDSLVQAPASPDISAQDFDSHLAPEEKLMDLSIQIIAGNKLGSEWLVVNNVFICHKNDSSLDGSTVYWECCKRKTDGCPLS